MKELKPMLRDDASDFERQLLGAVRRERPSPQLQAHMRGALGLTGPVAWLGAARAALSTAAGKSALVVAMAGLVAGGVLVSGGLEGARSEPTAPQAPTVVAAPSAAVPGAVLPVPQEAPAPAQATAEDPSSRQLREEILLLDQARAALQRGSRAAAVRELERYRERFPEGILKREATLLRQQVRSKAGASSSRSH